MNRIIIYLTIIILIFISGCGLYHDVQANANPIFNSSGYMVNGVEIGANVEKSLADFDTILQQSKLTYPISAIQASIDKKNYIDSIITDYAELSYYPSEIKIKEEQIRIYQNLFIDISTNHNKLKYRLEEYTYLSNNIYIEKQDLLLMDEIYSSHLSNFLEYTGLSQKNINMDLLFSNNDKTSEITLEYQNLKAEQGNNKQTIRRQNLQNYLPYLDLSIDTSNYLISGEPALAAGSSLDFSFSDIFRRINYNKILELENRNIDEKIPYEIFENRSISNLIERRIETLKSKIAILKETIKRNQDYNSSYYKLYKSKKIDLYKLITRFDDSINIKLDFIESQRQLFILRKRLEYGILSS